LNIETFWSLIDAAYEESGPFIEEYAPALQTVLSALPPDDLDSFDPDVRTLFIKPSPG
jgi:hypothetical protein